MGVRGVGTISRGGGTGPLFSSPEDRCLLGTFHLRFREPRRGQAALRRLPGRVLRVLFWCLRTVFWSSVADPMIS